MARWSRCAPPPAICRMCPSDTGGTFPRLPKRRRDALPSRMRDAIPRKELAWRVLRTPQRDISRSGLTFLRGWHLKNKRDEAYATSRYDFIK